MTSISGVSFDDAWHSRVPASLENIEVDIIGREQLIRNKLASGRSKDLLDVNELTKISRS